MVYTFRLWMFRFYDLEQSTCGTCTTVLYALLEQMLHTPAKETGNAACLHQITSTFMALHWINYNFDIHFDNFQQLCNISASWMDIFNVLFTTPTKYTTHYSFVQESMYIYI